MDPAYRVQARIFKALSDPNRLAILELLRGGEQCACVLLEQLSRMHAGLSYHRTSRWASGLVDSRQEGKWTHYRLNPTGGERAIDFLRQLTTPLPPS